MRTDTAQDRRSQREIERWTEILQRDYDKGIERLRWYLSSLALGRDFGASVEDHIAMLGLESFDAWAHEQLFV